MHLVLCANWEETSSLILTEDSSCQDPIWQQGILLNKNEHDLSRLNLHAETTHIKPFPDFSRDGHGCPVFSAKLLTLLHSTGLNNFDYYPAKIAHYESTEFNTGYYAINIVGLISCLDRQKSKFRELDGEIASIKLLAIDEKKTYDFDLFRLAELPRVILIHERFQSIFEKNKITGAQLVPPDNWDCFDGFRKTS